MSITIVKKLRIRGEVPDQAVVIYLPYKIQEENFKCTRCGKTLIKHQRRIIQIIATPQLSEPFLSPPISRQCDVCGKIYHFQGFIE